MINIILIALVALSFTIGTTSFYPNRKHSNLFVKNPLVRVAVVDTGFGPWRDNVIPMCDDGHGMMVGDKFVETSYPEHDGLPGGHGTHVSGAIHQAVTNNIMSISPGLTVEDMRDSINAFKQVTDTRYCQVILRVWDDTAPDKISMQYYKALEFIANNNDRLKIDVINISLSGEDFLTRESNTIKKLLDNNVIIVASAGNDNVNLDNQPRYPSMIDDRIIAVGFMEYVRQDGMVIYTRGPSSNYGSAVDLWEPGEILSAHPNNYKEGDVSIKKGTSQAAGIVSGKIVRKLIEKRSQDEH